MPWHCAGWMEQLSGENKRKSCEVEKIDFKTAGLLECYRGGAGKKVQGGRKEGGSFGRVSDTPPMQVPASSPAFAMKVFGLLTPYPFFELPQTYENVQPCLINFSGFVEKNRDEPAKAETLLGIAMSTSPQSWSHICGKEICIEATGSGTRKCRAGNTVASSGRPNLGAFSGVKLPKALPALPAFEELMAVIVSCLKQMKDREQALVPL